MELIELLKTAIDHKGSDVFLIPGAQAIVKAGGKLLPLQESKLRPPETEALIRKAYELANRSFSILEAEGEDDFSLSLKDFSRFRCNAYRQRGTFAITLRVVAFGLPDPSKRHIPSQVISLTDQRSGMILVTGPAGSGKSTTLACMIDRINRTRDGHIVTIEDPIEYLHPHKMSLVSQREVPNDSPSFAKALRAALRQAPDVIMLGEMRDSETISTAITAAETGHLVLSSLHTIGASKAVDRIIDSFPAEQQHQIRLQLSMVLKAVVSQRLVPKIGGGQIPAFEVLVANPAVQNMIRDGRTHQIDNVIVSGGSQNMLSMDNELIRLFREKQISRESAVSYAENPEMMEKKI